MYKYIKKGEQCISSHCTVYVIFSDEGFAIGLYKYIYSFEASSATGDAVNLDITDVTFSATTAAIAVTPSTTGAEMQTDPVMISQV